MVNNMKIEKVNKNLLDVEDATQEVIDYLEQMTLRQLPNDQNIKQKIKFYRDLGAEAKRLRQNILKAKKNFDTIISKENNYSKQVLGQGQKILTSVTSSINMIIMRQTHYLQIALAKAYVFIQKTRELLLNEELDYLIRVQGKNSQEADTLVHLNLKELIASFKLTVRDIEQTRKHKGKIESLGSLKREYKLVIANPNFLSQVKNGNIGRAINEDIQIIVNQLYKRMLALTYINSKGKVSKLYPGFAFETAVLLYQQYQSGATALSDAVLIHTYRKQRNAIAFFRGGDLTNAERLFLEGGENKHLELKNITGILGASLATANTIVLVLRTIEALGRKASKDSVNAIEKALKERVFKTGGDVNKQLAQSVDSILKDTIGKTLDEAFKS